MTFSSTNTKYEIAFFVAMFLKIDYVANEILVPIAQLSNLADSKRLLLKRYQFTIKQLNQKRDVCMINFWPWWLTLTL